MVKKPKDVFAQNRITYNAFLQLQYPPLLEALMTKGKECRKCGQSGVFAVPTLIFLTGH
jgi:hypothetical protein